MRDDRKQKLIVNMNAGMSRPDAARAAGYSESFCRVNVYKVTATPEFQDELARAKATSSPTSEQASHSASAPLSPSGDLLSAQSTGITELDTDEGLTLKERLFRDFYLGEARGNGTLAAKLAGYSGNDNALGQMAHHLLKKTKIQTSIQQLLDNTTMGATEVLQRLSQQARGSLADVLDDDGSFDLQVAKERGTDGLLRKVKIRTRTEKHRDGSETEFVDHDVEIHDSQSALEMMGRHHKLFTDRTENLNINVNAELEREELNAILRAAVESGWRPPEQPPIQIEEHALLNSGITCDTERADYLPDSQPDIPTQPADPPSLIGRGPMPDNY